MKTLITIFLFTTSICFCQTGFIEIEVRDTIRLKPETFEYHLRVNQSNLMESGENEPYNPKSANEKLKEKISELESFLTKNGYSFTSMHNATYELNNNSYFSNNGYIVTFTAAKDLQKLIKELQALNYVNGSLGELHYADEKKAEDRLFKKLLVKAREKASTIAKLSNLKLGKLIEFHEVREVDNLAYNMLDMYAIAQSSKKWHSGNNKLYGQKSKAIVVKFLAE